jgi:hypothetical protein
MADIPHAVLSEHFQERLRDRRLRSAVFTTYKFDPGFFEQEIIPVLIDIPVSHSKAIRLVQLEDALRDLKGEIAVYYDANGLIGESESARLDIRRIPIRHRTGIFHAKTVFLLLESTEADEGQTQAKSLLVANLSSNLTRAGWWENVESCHVEEIVEGTKTSLRDQIKAFLTALKKRTKAVNDHGAVNEILKFLKGVKPWNKRSVQGRLQTHFFDGSQSLADFLDDKAGQLIRGSNLEIISPYFDDAGVCTPLLQLVNRFQPREVRVFLPRSNAGEGLCRAELYESVSAVPNVTWGRLERELLRSGSSENAVDRFVHAKIYRFFTANPKREISFVGSANLTCPAHDAGGNLETGFLVDFAPPRRPDFWLTTNLKRPQEFQVHTENEEAAASGGTRLNLRYHWDSATAEVFWDAADISPELRLEARGLGLGTLRPIKPREWLSLSDELTKNIGAILTETSLITVYGESNEPTYLLVQEEAMWKKPSLLMSLSAADILTYWSLLTSEQRAAFIEARASELVLLGEGSDLVTRARICSKEQTLFDQFAGFFHAFGCLERSIRAALDENRVKEASYRLFGNKYDSLGHLLERVAETESKFDDVDRYLIVSCAKQLCRQIKEDYADFWKKHHREAKELEAKYEDQSIARESLIAMSPIEMPAFLQWFDKWFYLRATKVEIDND